MGQPGVQAAGAASPCLPQVSGTEAELGLVPAAWGWAWGRRCRIAPGGEEDADGGKGLLPAAGVLAWGCTS